MGRNTSGYRHVLSPEPNLGPLLSTVNFREHSSTRLPAGGILHPHFFTRGKVLPSSWEKRSSDKTPYFQPTHKCTCLSSHAAALQLKKKKKKGTLSHQALGVTKVPAVTSWSSHFALRKPPHLSCSFTHSSGPFSSVHMVSPSLYTTVHNYRKAGSGPVGAGAGRRAGWPRVRKLPPA